MNFYIIVYNHRFGVNVWPVRTPNDKPPTIDQVVATLDDWEPEREWIAIEGPYNSRKIMRLL